MSLLTVAFDPKGDTVPKISCVRERHGTVYIAPSASLPAGRMVDPATAFFWASWEDDDSGDAEDADIVGGDAAIAWGRRRAEVVLIRLGHQGDTYFSAGDVHAIDDEGPLPTWPPTGPPPEGWFAPGDR